MKFELSIDCDNAAFHDPLPELEVARILRRAADRLLEVGNYTFPDDQIPLRDTNGNLVGVGRFVLDDEVDDREFLQPDYDEELA